MILTAHHFRIFNIAAVILFFLSSYICVHGGRENTKTAVVAMTTENDERDDIKEDVTIEMETEQDDVEVFVPTEEWQPIKPGQAIPAGLHVKIGLKTGEKMAKLLDDDEKVGYKKISDDKPPGVNGEHSTVEQYTHQELKDALKKIKEDNIDKEKIDTIKKKFRSMDELKKDFAEINMNVETDVEIMKKLLKQYQRDGSSVEEQELVLYDLEFYAHQIDNAQDLVTIGGLDLIITALNDSRASIRKLAAFVLGSAVQSNPKVQVEAVERGAIQRLLHLITAAQPIDVRKKAMYSISSLVRQFPFAQLKFLRLGGLDSFLSLFRETTTDVVQLQVKAVTLLHDLLVEQKDIDEDTTGSDSNATTDKFRQYLQVDLLPRMMKQGWCDIIPSLLQTPEHDVREKILLTMQLVLDECQMNYYKDKDLIRSLVDLKREYERHADEEEMDSGGQDGYFRQLDHLIGNIMGQLSIE